MLLFICTNDKLVSGTLTGFFVLEPNLFNTIKYVHSKFNSYAYQQS